MNTVPEMISTKDLAYLADMFEWNFTLFKKANHFYNEIQDEEIKQMIQKAANLHQTICETITQILK